ncbi:MAG: GAF domain-containing sensor histidine kinase [Patescibacteria group bacterium]|nr:GAF domain-containing sensor histidine kinase [Patescibacteria group bacterium]
MDAIKKQQQIDKQKLYQISVLKEIQDKISYSLDVEQIIDIITGSLKNLFSYSSASSIVVKEDKLIFKTYVEENVSSLFISQVRKSMLASIGTLLPNLPTFIDQTLSGVSLDEANKLPLASFFHIPLIINNKVTGLINVSSTTPDLYKEDAVTTLYQITENASNALTRLRQVLEVEESKLTSMIGSLADGVFMVDDKNKLLIINEAARKFLNIQRENITILDILNEMSGKYDLLGKISESVTSKKAVEEKEVVIGENTFQIFLTPVFNSEEIQKITGVSVLMHDITIEKNLSGIKEDFTNMMVHELRAPLTAIKDSSELMLEEKKLKESEQKQLLGIIDSQAKVLLEQIGSVLDAAKIEAGRFIVQKAPNDLNQLINEVVDAFSPRAIKKNIEINSYVPKSLPQVNFDRTRITQVLNNLVSNSLKFTPSAGKITIFGEINTDSVTVSVSDTGMGISEEDQKDLFSKFYQIRKTPHELEKKGTGLGLYIVKGVVEAHGGQVVVKSDVGQGTTISFTLPLSDDVFHQNKTFTRPFAATSAGAN